MKSLAPLSPDTLISTICEKFKSSFDFIHKRVEIKQKEMRLYYLKTLVDEQRVQLEMIRPFFEMGAIADVEAYLTSLPDLQEIQSKEQVINEMTKGSVIVAINGNLHMFDFKKVNTNTVLETNIEPTIAGPQLALSEDILTNINLLAQRYRQPSLRADTYTVGNRNQQMLAVIYDHDEVDQKVLKKIEKEIESIDTEVVTSSNQLVFLLNQKKRSLFPTMMITERPDRMVYNLAGGKVILMLDGDSNAVIAPAIFFDFLSSAEDTYHSFWIVKFTFILRYLGLFACVILPGLYVAVASYNPDVFRSTLALSVAGSRIGVPYPSFIEVVFMLLVIELLTEASIRLPKAVSATATTVGGLILGTAVTEAALASNIMIIIISAVAISTFVIPINEMSFAIRVVRYYVLFFATIAGMAGLMLSLVGLVMHLSNRDSFGEPFLRMYYQNRKEELQENPP